MRRTATVLFTVVAAVSWQALNLTGSSAQSDQRPDEPIEAAVLALTDAEVADLSTTAEQMGLSFEEAVERYAWNHSFAAAVGAVRVDAGATFASAEIVDATTARLSFAGDAPDAALTAVEAFVAANPGVEVQVRTDAAVSELELEDLIEAAHYAVLDDARVADASTVYDEDAQQLTTSVALVDGTNNRAVDELIGVADAAIAGAGVSNAPGAITVTVTASDRAEVGGDDSSAAHLGGELLDGIGCTSGFGVVQEGTLTRGISTAGHCGNSGATDDGATLTYRGGHFGAHGDAQWHTGPQPHPSDFYAGSSTSTQVDRRTVSAVGAPVVGQTLCKNGRTNHKQCQEVRRLHVCRSSACNMVQMGARLAAGGDSGGPVYWGTTAYGLHSGWQYDPSWPFDRDYFSRADRLPDALGVHIAK